ncbi:MAG: CBS domain-containing protein [Myxococcota bacterium]
MKCRDVMKTNVAVCHEDEPVTEVCARMRDLNLGFIPVCDDAGHPIGTITDRDVAVRVVAEGRNPQDVRAREIMTTPVITCRPDDDLLVAEELMGQHKKSRMLCTNPDGVVQGVISLSDVAGVERGPRASTVLRSVSQREAHLH